MIHVRCNLTLGTKKPRGVQGIHGTLFLQTCCDHDVYVCCEAFECNRGVGFIRDIPTSCGVDSFKPLWSLVFRLGSVVALSKI